VKHLIGKPYGMAASGGNLFICDSGCATIEIADLANGK